jgi:hypothetical protein
MNFRKRGALQLKKRSLNMNLKLVLNGTDLPIGGKSDFYEKESSLGKCAL